MNDREYVSNQNADESFWNYDKPWGFWMKLLGSVVLSREEIEDRANEMWTRAGKPQGREGDGLAVSVTGWPRAAGWR